MNSASTKSTCNNLGLRLLKLGCAWPLVREEMVAFARGLDLIIVVEEKEALVETQLRALLYGTANQPVVIGKKDEEERPLFPAKGALDVIAIATCIGDRLLKFAPQPESRRARRAAKGDAPAPERNRRGRQPPRLFLLRLSA